MAAGGQVLAFNTIQSRRKVTYWGTPGVVWVLSEYAETKQEFFKHGALGASCFLLPLSPSHSKCCYAAVTSDWEVAEP